MRFAYLFLFFLIPIYSQQCEVELVTPLCGDYLYDATTELKMGTALSYCNNNVSCSYLDYWQESFYSNIKSAYEKYKERLSAQAFNEAHGYAIRKGYRPDTPQYSSIVMSATSDASNLAIEYWNSMSREYSKISTQIRRFKLQELCVSDAEICFVGITNKPESMSSEKKLPFNVKGQRMTNISRSKNTLIFRSQPR